MTQATADTLIEITNLKNHFGEQRVHDGLNLTVQRKEIIAIIGGSGCGKTTLLRSILMLRRPTAGQIKVFGVDILNAKSSQRKRVQSQWGVMFQSCALFTSLTIAENILFPIEQVVRLDKSTKRKIALLKLALAGLDPEVADKYPAELSGGMKKRVAMARAISLDPELIFLDEPTAGLDPVSANDLDELVLYLRDQLDITFVMVTHDLDTLWCVPDRIIFLGEGKVLAASSMSELMSNPHPLIQAYFSGARAKTRMR